MISEYGVVCSEMTDENIKAKGYDATALMWLNMGGLYVESIGILQQQMRRAIDGMWTYGDFIGDIEVTKSLMAGYTYLGLYEVTGNNDFSIDSRRLITMGTDTFAPQFKISPTDPRIEKQMAMLTVITDPLTGVDWDSVPEIQKTRETYLTSN